MLMMGGPAQTGRATTEQPHRKALTENRLGQATSKYHRLRQYDLA